jgi:hypothetical protein
VSQTAKRISRSLFFVAFLGAGCALGPDWAAISQQAATLRAGCESQFASGIIKTHLAAERCADGPILDLYAKAGWSDMDVLDAYLAKREAIASQWDRKAITPEEARAQLAQAVVDQNSELQRRAADRATSRAALRANMPVICTRTGATLICQ